MKFWDASGLISLMVEEPHSASMREIIRKDAAIAAWWGSPVECLSAFARLRREGVLSHSDEDEIRHMISLLQNTWTEIEPTEKVRETAERLLLAHPLRAADAFQLAAALVWAGRNPKGQHFVCLDNRLKAAARSEGFSVLPR
jgi:predicted nucleic acid-binding protein